MSCQLLNCRHTARPWRVCYGVTEVGMTSLSSYSFEKFTLDILPRQHDVFMMEEVWMAAWEAEWLKVFAGDDQASPDEVNFITPVHIAQVTPAGAEISWYANTHDRSHRVKTFLPRNAFVAAALVFEY